MGFHGQLSSIRVKYLSYLMATLRFFMFFNRKLNFKDNKTIYKKIVIWVKLDQFNIGVNGKNNFINKTNFCVPASRLQICYAVFNI